MDVWCSGAPQNTFINRQWRRSNFNKGYCTNKIASLCKICTHHQQHFCVMSAHIQAKACVDIVRIQFKVKCVCVFCFDHWPPLMRATEQIKRRMSEPFYHNKNEFFEGFWNQASCCRLPRQKKHFSRMFLAPKCTLYSTFCLQPPTFRCFNPIECLWLVVRLKGIKSIPWSLRKMG